MQPEKPDKKPCAVCRHEYVHPGKLRYCSGCVREGRRRVRRARRARQRAAGASWRKREGWRSLRKAREYHRTYMARRRRTGPS